MACQKCKSERILEVSAKCSDMCCWKMAKWKTWRTTYVPSESPIHGDGCGDYVDFSVCLNCGQMQGTWPSTFTMSKKEKEANGTD